MLDTETKRRIDTCRDILVGKVPDPKSQVEQITIALIYKFMDDMDAEAEELGGKRAFFAGDFAKYGWAKLMAPQLGGYDVLNLYSEAIGKMNENPGVPALFRDIFKNAYLPYRDPETLRSFLKEINSFTYDHSERLGDAFEYLLSVLGSQGDAGQFRTPRHIIDFMVALIDPQKDEKILDPACGTAGFLISAYKHILKQNTQERILRLTPEERTRLAANIHGYDISPDMVRLSLVNLYLHGFSNPRIEEYDTLTSEERWHEYADVILANPPFMSPKGGIKPHKRFSVQANRSEVLFVDYIAEHLTPTGRAAVVVPEGIIFQSGTAYKQLREMLVKHHLVGVISLPSGVFQPYTGVKTSILLLDRRRAKDLESILFMQVKNIGFSLGVKRTPIKENDLHQVFADYRSFCNGVNANSAVSFSVPKTEIAENDYLLTLKRYQKSENNSHIKFVPLEQVCVIEKGKSSSTKTMEGSYPLILTAENFGTSAHYDFEGEVVCVPLISSTGHGKASVKRIHYFNGKFALANLLAAAFVKDTQVLNSRFLFFLLDSAKNALAGLMSGAANVSMKVSDLEKFEIPLPPLTVQQEIVAEIEGYQQIIDGARQVVEHYRPRIVIEPAWPVAPLGELFQTKSGTTPRRDNSAYFENGNIPWVKTLDLTDGVVAKTEECITELALQETHLEILPQGTVLVAMYGGFNQIGRTGVLEIEATHNQAMTALLPNPTVNPYFLNTVLVSSKNYWKSVANSTRKDPNITKSDVLNFPLPLPDLATQRAIVAEIEEEQRLVAATHALIDRFTAKIARVINRVWEG
jgi:type I restriction enzyme M protein